jgi:HEAT repeat protein
VALKKPSQRQQVAKSGPPKKNTPAGRSGAPESKRLPAENQAADAGTEPVAGENEPLFDGIAIGPFQPQAMDDRSFSEDSLYSDEDPLARHRDKRTGAPILRPALQPPKPAAQNQASAPKTIAPEPKPAVSSRRGFAAKVDESKTRPAASKRTTARASKSMRVQQPPLKITKAHIALLAVFGVIVIVLVLGWKPFWRMMYTKTLDDGQATLGARKEAAGNLFSGYVDSALPIFEERLNSEDVNLCTAAAYGVELYGVQRSNGTEPVDCLAQALAATSKPTIKLAFIQSLSNILNAIARRTPGTEEAALDNKRNQNGAKALISQTEPSQTPEVRDAALSALISLRAPGVCRQLLKLAKAEQGVFRSKAVSGIVETAMTESVGDLLRTIGEPDSELAAVAKRAFSIVRDSAKSAELLPLLKDPADDVRREIVSALGKRENDTDAAAGITMALRDKSPEIRLLAVKAVLVTGISPVNELAEALSALVTDSSDEVQKANAETLGQLRDEDSHKVLLEAFGKPLKNGVLASYIKALGQRSYGKDLKAVALVMPLLSKPGVEDSLREALVLLTWNNVPGRKEQRRGWDMLKWQKWWEKISERENRKEAALAKLRDIEAQKQGDKSQYRRLMLLTDQQFAELDKCKELSEPDDQEDKKFFDDINFKYSAMRYMFQKSQTVEMDR